MENLTMKQWVQDQYNSFYHFMAKIDEDASDRIWMCDEPYVRIGNFIVEVCKEKGTVTILNTNSGKCEHPKPENRDFSFKLGIIRFIPSFYVYVQMKIFRLSNQNPYIDRPESAHRPRKIHILSNRKLSNYPVGVRPSSRRPHPKNAKLFLSIYRLCRASAGFIRPHPSLIPASPQPHPFYFPSPGVGLFRSLNRPSRSNSLSSLFPHSHPTERHGFIRRVEAVSVSAYVFPLFSRIFLFFSLFFSAFLRAS